MRESDTHGWNTIQLFVRLHIIRIRCNLTQGELAYRAGVSRNTITKLESGGDVKLSTLIHICNAMRMPMHAWFLPEDEWRKWYDFNIPEEPLPYKERNGARVSPFVEQDGGTP